MKIWLLSYTGILHVLMFLRFWLLPIPVFIRYPFETASIWIIIVWTYENAALDTGSVPSHNGSSSCSSSNRYGPGRCTLSIPTHSLTKGFCLVEILFTNILWLHSRNLHISEARCCSAFISVYTKRETPGPAFCCA